MTGSALRRLLSALALVVAAAVPDASRATEIRPMLKAGVDVGGETLADVTFADGSQRSIRANEGLYFGGGASILADSKDLEVEVSLSYKFARISRFGAHVDWTRFPLDVLVFYRLPQFRLGGGLTYHLDPKLKSSGLPSDIDAKFDNSAGLVLQADYVWPQSDIQFLWMHKQQVTAGLRFTSLEYKLAGVSTRSNGVGFTLGLSF